MGRCLNVLKASMFLATFDKVQNCSILLLISGRHFNEFDLAIPLDTPLPSEDFITRFVAWIDEYAWGTTKESLKVWIKRRLNVKANFFLKKTN
jgi:hypothetical protein